MEYITFSYDKLVEILHSAYALGYKHGQSQKTHDLKEENISPKHEESVLPKPKEKPTQKKPTVESWHKGKWYFLESDWPNHWRILLHDSQLDSRGYFVLVEYAFLDPSTVSEPNTVVMQMPWPDGTTKFWHLSGNVFKKTVVTLNES